MPHTREQWHVENEPHNVWDEYGLLVARVYSRTDDERPRSTLIAAAPEMLEMLQELEWVDMGGISRRCPSCDSPEIEGHDTCRLAALLKKARGE